MPIDKQIKQKTFSSEQQKSLINVIFTSHHLCNLMGSLLKEFNLSHEQFNVLRILRGSLPHKMRQKDILERMIAPNSNVTLIVKKLIDKKLISLTRSDVDLRAYEISITKYGLNLLKKVDKKLDKELPVINPLNESDAALLSNLLDKMRS